MNIKAKIDNDQIQKLTILFFFYKVNIQNYKEASINFKNALRFSQTNKDHESMNHSLIYLS